MPMSESNRLRNIPRFSEANLWALFDRVEARAVLTAVTLPPEALVEELRAAVEALIAGTPDKITPAHAGATTVITQQLRQNPAFTEPVIQHFIGLMNRHNHLMLVILNKGEGTAVPEGNTAVSGEAGA